ncbi:hypothetical protein PAPYR_9545 [Paratrimastix pyriformis]|uniref:Uroporphyrinogen-III synthase n=1 Tax=Paratrimastix pyriformis TaxID=342808 RepID=A0ABQ8UAR6_9EUKA|nr:hypothetical protein PAPYR_9545 [Paratrimastix pyriformis]
MLVCFSAFVRVVIARHATPHCMTLVWRPLHALFEPAPVLLMLPAWPQRVSLRLRALPFAVAPPSAPLVPRSQQPAPRSFSHSQQPLLAMQPGPLPAVQRLAPANPAGEVGTLLRTSFTHVIIASAAPIVATGRGAPAPGEAYMNMWCTTFSTGAGRRHKDLQWVMLACPQATALAESLLEVGIPRVLVPAASSAPASASAPFLTQLITGSVNGTALPQCLAQAERMAEAAAASTAAAAGAAKEGPERIAVQVVEPATAEGSSDGERPKSWLLLPAQVPIFPPADY